MRPSLQTSASVNVTLALPSSACSSKWRAALPRGLAPWRGHLFWLELCVPRRQPWVEPTQPLSAKSTLKKM